MNQNFNWIITILVVIVGISVASLWELKLKDKIRNNIALKYRKLLFLFPLFSLFVLIYYILSSNIENIMKLIYFSIGILSILFHIYIKREYYFKNTKNKK